MYVTCAILFQNNFQTPTSTVTSQVLGNGSMIDINTLNLTKTESPVNIPPETYIADIQNIVEHDHDYAMKDYGLSPEQNEIKNLKHKNELLSKQVKYWR